MKHIKLKSINELIIEIQRSTKKTQNELCKLVFNSNNISRYRLRINFEMSKIKLFKEHASSLIKDRFPTKTHDWLVMMRHYHFPTRILDWTENAIIFAKTSGLCFDPGKYSSNISESSSNVGNESFLKLCAVFLS